MDYLASQIKIIFLFLIYSLSVGSTGNYVLNASPGTRVPEILQDDVFFEIVDPVDLSYTYRTRPAKNFGGVFNRELSKNIRLVPVEPPEGCTTPTNADELNGNIALIERGVCTFLSKTLIAERAGAKGVIIADNTPSEEFYIEMSDDLSGIEVSIPATFLLGKNGFYIRRTLMEKKLPYAVINIPVNLTYVTIEKFNQPPWLAW